MKNKMSLICCHLFGGYLCGGGVDDEQISVHCYQQDGETGEEDTACLGCSNQLTKIVHVLPQCPVLNKNNTSFMNLRPKIYT